MMRHLWFSSVLMLSMGAALVCPAPPPPAPPSCRLCLCLLRSTLWITWGRGHVRSGLDMWTQEAHLVPVHHVGDQQHHGQGAEADHQQEVEADVLLLLHLHLQRVILYPLSSCAEHLRAVNEPLQSAQKRPLQHTAFSFLKAY